MPSRSRHHSRLATAWISLCLLCLLALVGCKSELYSSLPEQEANEMLALLLKNNIPSEKFQIKEDFGLRVESRDIERAILVLQNSGFPKRHFMGVEDVFPPGSMISSTLEQQARLNYVMTQDLSRTISQIDGVMEARVHIAFAPTDNQRTGKPPKNSAAVFIKYDPDYDLTSLMPQIRNLVANSITEVSYADVAVVLVPSMPTPVPQPHTPHPFAWSIGFSLGFAGIILLGLIGFIARRLHKKAGMDTTAQRSPNRPNQPKGRAS